MAQILIWLVAGSIVWSFRDLMVGVGSKESAYNSRFAIAVFGGAGINAIAALAFLLRQRRRAWVLLVAVQGGDFVFTVAEGALLSHWWWLISAVAAITLALLYVFPRPGR